MARAHFRLPATDRAGNVIQNAKVFVYEHATTTPVTDLYFAASGGGAQSFLISDSKGFVEGWLDTPRLVTLRLTDNANTAHYPSNPAALQDFPDVDVTHDVRVSSSDTVTTAILVAHLADASDAHDASAISILDTANDFAATDVEGALAELQADNEAHVAAGDPHPSYLTSAEGDAAYGRLAVANSWDEDNIGEKSWHFMGPNPWVDVEKKYGLVVGAAASTTDQENNADGINAAISDNWEQPTGRRILLPPGVTHTRGVPIGYTASVDTSAELEIMGFGWDSTMIWQRSSGVAGMRIETTGGNLRRLAVRDFTIRNSDPSYNLELLKVGYSIFERLLLWTGGGIHVGTNSFQNVLRDFWWLNCSGNAILVDTASEATFENPLIGEAGGAIYVNAAHLRIRGGQMRQFPDRVDLDGPEAMGKTYFVVTGDGSMSVEGVLMTLGDQSSGATMCSINNGIAVFKDNKITLLNLDDVATFTLIKQRTMTGPQYFQFVGNNVEIHDSDVPLTVQIYDQFIGTEPHDSIIADNTFLSGTNVSMTIEDTIFDPDNHNVYRNNTAKETTGVT